MLNNDTKTITLPYKEYAQLLDEVELLNRNIDKLKGDIVSLIKKDKILHHTTVKSYLIQKDDVYSTYNYEHDYIKAPEYIYIDDKKHVIRSIDLNEIDSCEIAKEINYMKENLKAKDVIEEKNKKIKELEKQLNPIINSIAYNLIKPFI